MDEHQVKIALEKYHQFKRMHQKAGDKIDEIACKKYKVGGSVIKLQEQTVDKTKVLLDLMEREEPLIQDYQLSLYFIQLAEQFISTLPEADKNMCYDKYILRHSETKLSHKYNYSREGLRYRINRLIKRFVDCT